MERYSYKTTTGKELDAESEKKLRWCQKSHSIGNVVFVNNEIYKINEIIFNCENEETVVILDQQFLSARFYKEMITQ